MSSQSATRELPRATRDALLAHLAREQDWIRAARESLLVIRRVAVAGNLAQLDAALREQQRLEVERAELSAARPLIFGQAAAQLGIDAASPTLGGIAARLDPQARLPMLAARRELLGGARALRMLAGGAMAVIARNGQLVDGLLADLLGVSPAEARYTADGRRQDAGGRPLVECRT
jgi:hypothetical protein